MQSKKLTNENFKSYLDKLIHQAVQDDVPVEVIMSNLYIHLQMAKIVFKNIVEQEIQQDQNNSNPDLS
jgi:cellobiose-specific phosphotransferase system component IIB